MSYTNGTAVLQFPSHYVPLTEEEMTYVDGGKYSYAVTSYAVATAYSKMTNCARVSRANATATAIGATAYGAILGSGAGLAGTLVGAVLGAVGGLIAGSILWSWANAYDNAAMDAKRLQKAGRTTCKVHIEMNNSTMRCWAD